MKVFGLVFVLVSLSFSSGSQCPVSPSLWCSSPAVAKQCGVYEQCNFKLFSMDEVAAEPVKIDVYFESFCPDSMRFVVDQLNSTYHSLMDIMVPNLVPYGKARYAPNTDGSSWVFVCQHGQKECEGNKIMNCIIKESGMKPQVYVPVIACMMDDLDAAGSDPIKAAPKCVAKGELDWNQIDMCAYGNEGSSLLHDSGVLTENLDPKLTWVPWIVRNGVHTDEIQEAATTDFTKFVCESYQGTPPKECNSR